jgi:hypothetical protein
MTAKVLLDPPNHRILRSESPTDPQGLRRPRFSFSSSLVKEPHRKNDARLAKQAAQPSAPGRHKRSFQEAFGAQRLSASTAMNLI